MNDDTGFPYKLGIVRTGVGGVAASKMSGRAWFYICPKCKA
jgi:hypothetical protein